MNTSSKIQSVYRNQNVLISAVFERAGDARKVLCVALYYAKRKHVALICDGHGDDPCQIKTFDLARIAVPKSNPKKKSKNTLIRSDTTDPKHRPR